MSESALPKAFEHAQVDPKWYAFWERIGAFKADPTSTRPPFSMVIPPPNVTGFLHIGHALNQTLPDIIIRWKRMQGFDVLWLPGTDHAGIATQNVVEKQLQKEGKTRHDLGREAFEARVWEWVRHSHGVITGQMRQLGSSVDWSRERFTLDDALSGAVRKVFVSLYHEDLIYRDKYIVNWCPRCRTALSDLEVVHKESKGKLWYVRYALTDGQGSVTVATTRPETMLGDTAVAVNPVDERYEHLAGKTLRLPLLGRELPIVRDEFVDPAFGTGAVKVTPAHDPNDFAIGQRHRLPQVLVIDEDGRMTAEAGPFAGLDRFKARAAVVEQLEAEGLIEKVVEHTHQVGQCDRCATVVEPLVSTQWFVRIQPLAREAIRVVEEGRIQIVPENWRATYDQWMTNIHDWCISRQLWWGHRIPAWYCDACHSTIVQEDTPAACTCGGPLRQETDVLDTWFSSGLWPFSTMGWPERTADLQRYYPTSLLITGFDIIFFWVARMIMLGVKFMDDVPFRQVYFTSLVRDAHGQKMSKSKGNVVNPLDVMGEIGADAFRFALAVLASPGMDISLSEGRLRSSRQFVNKIWNASRFVLMNVSDVTSRPALPSPAVLNPVDRWILHRVSELAADVSAAWTAYRFDVAADRLYHFFWHEYADWYIELVKPRLQPGAPDRDHAVAVILEVHDRVLRMLHPMMPFVTEEVWQQLPRAPRDSVQPALDGRETITLAPFPSKDDEWASSESVAEVELLQDLIGSIRAARSERGVPPSRRIAAIVQGASPDIRAVIVRHLDDVMRLAALETVSFADSVARDPDTVRRLVRDMQVHLPLAGIVDREAEKGRVRKELAGIEKQLAALESKRSNPMFRERADPDVVQETEQQVESVREQRQQLSRILEELES